MGCSKEISYFIFALILAIVVKNGWTIKCWECRSDDDPHCADPFDNITVPLTDCSMCRKVRQKVQDNWKYIRTCARLGEPGVEGDEKPCLQRTGTDEIFMEYCTCNNKDGCNGGNKLKVSPFLAVLTIMAIFMSKIM